MFLDVHTDAWHALTGGPEFVARLCAGWRYPAEPRAPFVWADGSATSSGQELRVRSVYKRTLPFYQGWSLYALDVVPPTDHYEWTRALFVANDSFIGFENRAISAADWPDDRPPVVHLIGKHEQFASLNVPNTLTLTLENSLAYLEFVCAAVGGNDGPWILLSASTDVVEGAWSRDVCDLLRDLDLRQWRALRQQVYRTEYEQAKAAFRRRREAHRNRRTRPQPAAPVRCVPKFSFVHPDRREQLLRQGHEDALRQARHVVVPPRLVTAFDDGGARVLRYKLVLQYHSSIFEAALDVTLTTGAVEMPYDRPLVNRAPIATCETLAAPLIGITYYARPKPSVSWLPTRMEDAEESSGPTPRYTYVRGVFRGDLDLRDRLFKRLVLDRCVVEGSLLLDGSTFAGGLEINDCQIAGGLSADGLSIEGPTRIARTAILGCSASADTPRGLACRRGKFEGDVTLVRVDVLGTVDFQDTKCSGAFTFEGLRLRENQFWDRWGAGRVSGDLVLTGATLAALRLARSAPSRGLPSGTSQRNEIAGRLQANVRKAECMELADISAASMTCKGATVAGELRIRNTRIASQITAEGRAESDATIDLRESKVARLKCAAIKASSILGSEVVCGSASFRRCHLTKDLNLARGRFTGYVQVEQSVVREVLQLSAIAGSDVGIVGSLVGAVEMFTGTMNRFQIRPGLARTFRPTIMTRFDARGIRVRVEAAFWGLHCHSDFLMTNCSVEGPVGLWSAEWEGTLLSKREPDILKMLPEGWRPTTSIGGTLNLTSLSATSLNLGGVTAGGKVVLDHLRLNESLTAGARVQQNCRHQRGHVQLPFTCGSFSMDNAECGGDADLSGLRVMRDPHVALRPHAERARFWRRHIGVETDTASLDVVRPDSDQLRTATSGDVSARRLKVGGELWLRRAYGPGGDEVAFAAIDGKLDMSDASSTRLSISGESFGKADWEEWRGSHPSSPWWISFERGKFEEFFLNEPFPFAVNYDQISVGQWDIRPEGADSHLKLLQFSCPFRKATYLAIVRDRRNAGDDEAATKVWDAMHVREFTQRGADEIADTDAEFALYRRTWRKSRGWRVLLWPFEVLWHLVMRFLTHFLADTRPLLNVWLVLLVLSVGVFSTRQNIAASPEFNQADDEGQAHIPVEQREVLDRHGQAITTAQGMAVIQVYPKYWGPIEPLAMAVRYNVPLAPLLTERRWEPAQEGAALVLNPLRWDPRCEDPDSLPSGNAAGVWEHCQPHLRLPVSPQDWASLVSILNWIIVPMYLYGRIARKFSDVR